MRLSSFNVYVDGYPTSGETLIHNTFSGAFAVLDDDTLEALRRADRGEPLSELDRELVRDPDLRDPDVGVVVDSHEAEEAEYRAWFEARKDRHNRLTAIVGVNLACNFDCPYCCQAEVMRGDVMKPEIAADTARWLARRALEIGAASVHLTFVGGEPLLHPGRIESIIRDTRALLGDDGPPLTFGLITNGYYLDQAMVDRLVPLGLTAAQVTLDGDETTHHLTRVHKKGENTFQRIFDHIVAASRRIQINVNGNYQDDTVHGFAPLVEKLAAVMPKTTKVSLTPALDALAAPEGSGSGACTWSDSSYGHMVAFHDSIVRAGFPAPDFAVGPCAFHDRHNYAVDPDGTLYKCPGFLGQRQWGIGHVSTGLSDRYHVVVGTDTQADCGGCSHRPVCAGGCVASVWVERGRAEGTNCEKTYFEALSSEVVPRKFVLAVTDEPRHSVREFPPRKMSSSMARGIRPEGLRVVA